MLLVTVLCICTLVGCGCNGCGKADEGLNSAKEYLDTVMKAGSENTPADYTVLNKVVIGKDEYTVTWSVDVTEGVKVVVAEDGTVTIDVDERAAADIAYVLKATIKNAEGKTIETSYNRKVPAFKELTWAEFTATEDDTAVVISGIITGIINTETKHELYLEDKDGGYYVYNIAAEKMEGLVIGMEVRVLGIRDTYYGVNQVIEASIEIINETPAPVEPTDITDLVKAAANLKDASLTKYQSMLVTIKGVTILGQSTKNNTYYEFSIDGKTSYVRISGSANMLSSEDTATFEKNVADNIGMSATATGLVSIYDNQIYLIPVTVDAYKDFEVLERTPAEQVEFEKGLLEVPSTITAAGEITLSGEAKLYKDVKITWALAETTFATLAGNKLNIPILPDEEQTIKLTATFTSGDATTQKEYTVKIAAAPSLVPDMVKGPAANTTYKFYIRQYNTNQTLYFAGYDNGLTVTTDPTKAVDVGLEPVEGKDGEYYFYYMVGELKNYIIVSDVNGKYAVSASRYNNGSNTYKYNADFDMLVTTVTIADKEVTYWFGTYSQNAKLGISDISYIKDSNYNISQFPAHFGTLIDVDKKTDAEKVEREKNDLTIKTEFDELGGSVKLPAYGDLFVKVTITWEVEANPAVVFENGTLKAIPQSDGPASVKVKATITHGSVTQTKEFTVKVAQKTSLDYTSIPAFNEIALKQPDKGDATTDKYFVQGVVVEIKSTQYGNLYIQDAEGNKLYVYGLYDATGANRYDALGANAPQVGDLITVYGVAANYNGAQMKNGWLVEHVKATSIPEANKAGAALPDKGEASKDKYLVTGTITEIKSTQYGNMYIQDAEGNKLYVYGLYSADGSVRFDKMEPIPAVGDTITVYGVLSNYGGAQMKNGWLLLHTIKEPEQGGETPDPDEPKTVTIPAFNEIALKQPDKGEATAEKYIISGVIVKIASDKYGNMYIQDGEGNQVYVYGLYSADGSVRYDAMEKKPAVGDYITVLGVACNYGGAQMKNAWLQAHVAATSITDANTAGAALPDKGAASEDKYLVTGTITDIVSDKYGNMHIQDEAGNKLYLYGLYSADGSVRYDAMAKKPAVGDIITVYGVLSNYGGAQLKNGWLLSLTVAEKPAEDDTTKPSVPTTSPLATFTFGANGDAQHVDGNDLGATTSYTEGSYTLELKDMTKVYGPAYDEKGNSCIKLGTSKVVGGFSFTVADNVKTVVIRVAAYKANAGKISVNGVEYDISANKSNEGSYMEIVIDTTTTKTVTLTTVASAYRAMVDSIAYYG